MSKPAGFKGVIKPVNWGLNFVIVPREFAQDMTISPFTKAVVLDVQSRSEDWETNPSTIMHNYDVGRDKARSVLREGMRAGYVYAHRTRSAREYIEPVTYHFSTCKRTLKEFVVANGWETEESYSIQGMKMQALDGDEKAQTTKSWKYIDKGPVRPGPENPGPGVPRPGDRTQRKKRRNERTEEEKEAVLASPAGVSLSEEPHVFDASVSSRIGGRDAAAGERTTVAESAETEFDALISDYRKGAPGAPAGGETQARALFYKLKPEERVQLRAAMVNYFGTLKKEKWRSPQSVSKFVLNGWRDFVPTPIDKANMAADELQTQICCVAMDINENRHLMAKKWWDRPEDVPADIREKAMAHAINEYLYEPSAA